MRKIVCEGYLEDEGEVKGPSFDGLECAFNAYLLVHNIGIIHPTNAYPIPLGQNKIKFALTHNIPFSSTTLSTRDGKNPIPIKNDLILLPDELATLSWNHKGRTEKELRNFKEQITH